MSKKIVVDAKIDLHGLTQDGAFEELRNFFIASILKGRKQLLIITGKGRSDKPSVLKTNLPRWLRYTQLSEFVSSCNIAPEYLGGEGAFIIKLKKQYNEI